MAVQTSVLDTAGRVDIEYVPVRDQSDGSRGVLITYWPHGEGRVVRRFSLRWDPCSHSIAERVMDHYEENPGAFDYHPPGSEEPVSVIWAGAPQIRRRNAMTASALAVLEEALATS